MEVLWEVCLEIIFRYFSEDLGNFCKGFWNLEKFSVNVSVKTLDLEEILLNFLTSFIIFWDMFAYLERFIVSFGIDLFYIFWYFHRDLVIIFL